MITADELTKLVDQFPAADEKGILSGADREAMLAAVKSLQEHGQDAVVALVNLLAGPAQGGDTRPAPRPARPGGLGQRSGYGTSQDGRSIACLNAGR